jgi:predicted subunit of tRNA(5-methylaminomethyl-2-thiouridylate) methyltransferase
MIELESSLHLYQQPLYRGTTGSWKTSFLDAVGDCDGKITWDPAAILAILDFSFTCGDRTLVNEIKRRPWLSKIGVNDEPQPQKIPNHGRLWQPTTQIAANLGRLLYNEAFEVCEGRKEIYVLLSGGLDSRIVAGTIAKLYKEAKLAIKPITVTWGLEDSRDVVYGRMVAEILGFEWIHVNIGYEDVAYNIEEMGITVGALVSPIHLHCMHWFKNVSDKALVLAACYGDSVGRAEFSSTHLLELDYLSPVNGFGLLNSKLLAAGYEGITNDLKSLHDRSPNQLKYATCEHEQQGHYMRNMIAHAMSAIGQYCDIYQMFTHPKIYSYMWSIHPALRNDQVYVELLKQLNSKLSWLPWARTNRALKGKTVGAKHGLRKNFHDYLSWVSGPLFDKLYLYVDPEWFAETGIFDRDKIQNLAEQVRRCKEEKVWTAINICQKWLWLAAFRRMAEHLEGLGKSIQLDKTAMPEPECALCPVPKVKRNPVKRILRRSDFLSIVWIQWQNLLRKIRRRKLRKQSIRKYPPLEKQQFTLKHSQ